MGDFWEEIDKHCREDVCIHVPIAVVPKGQHMAKKCRKCGQHIKFITKKEHVSLIDRGLIPGSTIDTAIVEVFNPDLFK